MRDKYLRYTLESGSTRIFNCLSISQTIEADYANGNAPLFFANKELNYTIFIKDHNPFYNGQDDPDAHPIGTKIYVPYETSNIYAGGRSIFIGERGFQTALFELIGENVDVRAETYERDMQLIRLLDSMPALDPFLVRDALMNMGLEIDKRYFQISENEWEQIQAHIRQRLRPMVALALPDGIAKSEERMGEMVDTIWLASDMSKLEPLIRAFLLPVERTGEIFYAWKGIAFFEFHYMKLTDSTLEFAKWLAEKSEPTHSVKGPEKEAIDELRSRVRAKVKERWKTATGILKDYNYSYEKLFKKRDSAVDYMKFIGKSPEYFWTLGDCIIRLQHAVETWDKMTGATEERRLEADGLRLMLTVVEDLL